MKQIQIAENNKDIKNFNISLELINMSEKLTSLYKNIGDKVINKATIDNVSIKFFQKFLEYYNNCNINDLVNITKRFLQDQKKYIIDLIIFSDKYKFNKLSEIIKKEMDNIIIDNVENIRIQLNLKHDFTEDEMKILNHESNRDIKNNSNYDLNNEVFNNINDMLFLTNLDNQSINLSNNTNL